MKTKPFNQPNRRDAINRVSTSFIISKNLRNPLIRVICDSEK